jgi:hypothetical protein
MHDTHIASMPPTRESQRRKQAVPRHKQPYGEGDVSVVCSCKASVADMLAQCRHHQRCGTARPPLNVMFKGSLVCVRRYHGNAWCYTAWTRWSEHVGEALRCRILCVYEKCTSSPLACGMECAAEDLRRRCIQIPVRSVSMVEEGEMHVSQTASLDTSSTSCRLSALERYPTRDARMRRGGMKLSRAC